MEILTIDLKKNPDIAELVRTMQPGDPVDLHTSIKALDEQTASLTVREASEGKPFDDDEEEEAPEGDDQTPPGASQDGAQAGAGPDAMGLQGGEAAGT